jgi:hypothetical protein
MRFGFRSLQEEEFAFVSKEDRHQEHQTHPTEQLVDVTTDGTRQDWDSNPGEQACVAEFKFTHPETSSVPTCSVPTFQGITPHNKKIMNRNSSQHEFGFIM